jgi:LacI family transcriptional regulator
MSITISDIAREARVGVGTVSRVLNNHPNVSQATREKVLEVAQKLNYQPHAFAQGLARRRSNILAAIIPFFTNYFFIEILHGIQDKIQSLGYDLMLYGLNENNPEQFEKYLLRATQKGRVDGLMLFSLRLPPDFAEQYRGINQPFVLVDCYQQEFDSITVDNCTGAYAATKHLVSLGHTRIGMINANPGAPPAQQRLEGFKNALKESGLSCDNKLIKSSKVVKYDGFSREAGYLAMIEMLEMGAARPTAIFVASDIQAMGAMTALRDNGLKVPDDMAIVGFDDIELAQHIGLTTVRQPMYEMGVLAVGRILDRMTDRNGSVTHTTFTPKLIVRESCGAVKEKYVSSNNVMD